MSEENKINQEISQSEPIEDVFSNVDNVEDKLAPSVPQEETPPKASEESMNISEASIGQEETPVVKEKAKPLSEPQVYNPPKEKNQSVNTGKIFFYSILVLIVLLGAFAIWALAF